MLARNESEASSILLPVLVLGAVGFAAGFFGPMVLNPGANQGPLLGIFISGPGGALLGLALGVVLRIGGVSAHSGRVVLIVVALLLAGVTLFYCLPEPETRGLVVAGDITDCQPPAALTEAAIAEWRENIARAPWGHPRTGWERDVPRMLRESPGVVLTLQVRQQNRILEHRKPWNAGKLSAAGWQAADEASRYFADYAGADCAGYRDETPLLYVPYGQGSTVWPPDDLSNFLGFARIEPAPERERLLTGTP